MGARPKHDIAPLVRTAFVNALGLIEKDTGKTLPEMMRDCIEQHGLLAVLDKLSKYTVRERHTTLESKPIIKDISSTAIEEWINSTRRSGQQDEAIPLPQAPEKPRIQ